MSSRPAGEILGPLGIPWTCWTRKLHDMGERGREIGHHLFNGRVGLFIDDGHGFAIVGSPSQSWPAAGVLARGMAMCGYPVR